MKAVGSSLAPEREFCWGGAANSAGLGARRRRQFAGRRSGGRMLNTLRAVARFFQKHIGWNRIGVLLSVAIITIAVIVLIHMLRDIDTHEVINALKATEGHHIAAAAIFVAGGYFTLTFYDWFALRTIGHKEIPYRIAARTAFPAFSL